MSLSVGIVGLPNAGKSTLFNALASRRLSETASRPFTTIEPHEAVVGLPDEKLEKLSRLISPEKTIPADITFIDIAGLVKGAHKGEGLGNQFLAKIKEVDAIVHVVRAFKDDSVTHQHPTHEPGSPNQIVDDIEIINLELELGGIEKKPTIIVLNTNEGLLFNEVLISLAKELEEKYSCETLLVSAKLEEDLIDLEPNERKDYLKEFGVSESGFESLIKKAFKLLDLIKFYTVKGGKEVSAWSLVRGKSSIDAAERVHTEFAQKFIKAEVVNVDNLLSLGGWKEARDKGKVSLEGKDYIVEDEDVIEFKIGS